MKLLIAIPSYNCATQLARVLESVAEITLACESKVVVVENRSSDSTLKVALSSASLFVNKDYAVFQNVENYGLGGSHKVAFSLAAKWNFDLIAILHGDDQGSVEDLPLMIAKMEKDEALVAVLGSRFAPGSIRSGYSKLRTYGNYCLNAFYSLMAFRPILDMGAGLNLYRVRFLENLDYRQYPNQFTFNPRMLLEMCSKNLPFIFSPITWREADQISNAKTFRVGWQVLMIVLRWRFGLKFPSIPNSTYPSDLKSEN